MPAQLRTCSVAGVGCFTPPLATWRAPPEGRPEAVLRCGFALPRKGRANPPSVASGGDDRREEASFRLRKHGLLLAEQTAKSAWNTVVTTGFLSPTTEWGRCVEMLIFQQYFHYRLWQIR